MEMGWEEEETKSKDFRRGKTDEAMEAQRHVRGKRKKKDYVFQNQRRYVGPEVETPRGIFGGYRLQRDYNREWQSWSSGWRDKHSYHKYDDAVSQMNKSMRQFTGFQGDKNYEYRIINIETKQVVWEHTNG